MSRVVIFGTGQFAEVAWFYLTRDSEHEVVGFTVNEAYLTSPTFNGLPVHPYERLSETCPPETHSMFVAIGFSKLNANRAEVYESAKQKGYELVTYISSKATYYGTPIGDNCLILEDNTIQPFVEIGNNVVLWSGNHVGHHSRIGDHCFVSSHVVISGGVTVGDYSFLGVNATLRDHITIGQESVIGAGALIMRDTEPKSVYTVPRTKIFMTDSSQLNM